MYLDKRILLKELGSNGSEDSNFIKLSLRTKQLKLVIKPSFDNSTNEIIEIDLSDVPEQFIRYRETSKLDYGLTAYFRNFDPTTNDFVFYLQSFSYYKGLDDFEPLEILEQLEKLERKFQQNEQINGQQIISLSNTNNRKESSISKFYNSPLEFIEEVIDTYEIEDRTRITSSRIFVAPIRNSLDRNLSESS